MKRLIDTGAWKGVAAALLIMVPGLAAPAAAQRPCTVEVKVSPGNQSVTEGEAVRVNGGPGQGNAVVTYWWVQTSGTPVVFDASDRFLEFTAPQVGPGGETLAFLLTVTGCDGTRTATATATVSVTNQNDPPVAAIAVASPVNEGDFVELDGSASSDPDGDSLTYSWTQIGGPIVALQNASETVASFTAPPVGPDGVSLTFRLTVSDGSQTNAQDAIVNVVNVNQPPVVSAQCPATADERSLTTLVATATDDEQVSQYSWSHIDGAPPIASDDWSSASLSFSVPSLGLGQAGLLAFKVTVTDNRGLSAEATCSVQINDVTAPALALPDSITAEATSAAGAVVSFDASADDEHDGSVDTSCSPASGASFALGTTTVTCSASDAAGNEATGSFDVNVVDTTPPALTLPADQTVEATGPLGAAVSFVAAATDLVSGNVPVACTPASGTTFPLGNTAVTCQALDGAGNEATGAFTVTVQDTTPPAIEQHPDVVVILGSAPPYYTPPAGNDLVDGVVTVTCAPLATTAFALGTTTVTCSASDRRGNAATSSFALSVRFAPAGLCAAGPGRQVLQPIALTGTSVFRQTGSTVPVKFRVCDVNGNAYHAANPVSAFQLVRVIAGTATTEPNSEVVSTSADSAFRWSDADQFWMFNLSTRAYASGATYVFRISLVDGSAIEFQFGLK